VPQRGHEHKHQYEEANGNGLTSHHAFVLEEQCTDFVVLPLDLLVYLTQPSSHFLQVRLRFRRVRLRLLVSVANNQIIQKGNWTAPEFVLDGHIDQPE
jgi:hypothetical protein